MRESQWGRGGDRGTDTQRRAVCCSRTFHSEDAPLGNLKSAEMQALSNVKMCPSPFGEPDAPARFTSHRSHPWRVPNRRTTASRSSMTNDLERFPTRSTHPDIRDGAVPRARRRSLTASRPPRPSCPSYFRWTAARTSPRSRPSEARGLPSRAASSSRSTARGHWNPSTNGHVVHALTLAQDVCESQDRASTPCSDAPFVVSALRLYRAAAIRPPALSTHRPRPPL